MQQTNNDGKSQPNQPTIQPTGNEQNQKLPDSQTKRQGVKDLLSRLNGEDPTEHEINLAMTQLQMMGEL